MDSASGQGRAASADSGHQKQLYALATCKYYRVRAWAIGARKISMRTVMPALAMMALFGFCSQANAQAQCSELTRLRSEAAETSKQTRRGLISDRCEAYIRSSIAWDATVQYANDHRELCDISIHSLSEFEKYHREAVSARDNVCSGRPARPFPPEIIQR
jgi:hypothetical protein